MQFWPSKHSTLLHPHLVSAEPKRELNLHPYLPAMRLNKQNEAQLVSNSLTLTSHEEDPLGTEAITLGGIIKAEQGGAGEGAHHSASLLSWYQRAKWEGEFPLPWD